MKIQILGNCCHNCLELEMRLAEAVVQSGRSDVEVARVDNITLDAIPGLLIDGQPVSQREIPNIETLLGWLGTVPA